MSEQLGSVSLEADFLFGRCIPHLDVDGRITGNPKGLKAKVCPLRDELSHQKITHLLKELDEAELLVWYEVNGQRFLEFPGFDRHQKGRHKDREAESKIPSSKVNAAQRVREKSPNVADELRTKSGSGTDEVHPKRSKEKLSEEELSKEKIVPDAGASRNGSSWVGEATELWNKLVGHVEAGRVGRTLKPVVLKYSWPQARAGLLAYIECNNGKVRKLEYFAAEDVRWVEQIGKMPLNDDKGLTERGRMVEAAARRLL